MAGEEDVINETSASDVAAVSTPRTSSFTIQIYTSKIDLVFHVCGNPSAIWNQFPVRARTRERITAARSSIFIFGGRGRG